MRNRVSKQPAARHSLRFLKEASARQHAARDPAIGALYKSRDWFVLRARVKRDANGLCEWPECNAVGVSVDHRRPHKGDRVLFFDRGNLWLLCKTHHDRKTARHDGGFGNKPRALAFNDATMWPAVGPGGVRGKKKNSEGGGFGFV